jgi:chemotaxis protein MotA
MKTSWIGVILCALVIYFGIVHSLGNSMMLLNAHAAILVVGGTFAIVFLTYSPSRISEVLDFILLGFLFRHQRTELHIARDLICAIDEHYDHPAVFVRQRKPHPFIDEAFKMLNKDNLDIHSLFKILQARRDAVKRRYSEDAKILNNIAKYPPHLGLLGAASGMIEMMSGLGSAGVGRIGAAMAVALSATLWGVGLNNFVFLPLSDNSSKAADDEVFCRDLIIECCLQIKKGEDHDTVIETCLSRLSFADRSAILKDYQYEKPRRKVIRVA